MRTYLLLPILAIGAFAGTPSSDGGRVKGFRMSAKPSIVAGKCPQTVEFNAVIAVAKPPVTVEYQWERSDGATSRTREIVIRNAGAKVTDTWKVGGKGEHGSVWEKVHVISPNDITSGAASAKLDCR